LKYVLLFSFGIFRLIEWFLEWVNNSLLSY